MKWSLFLSFLFLFFIEIKLDRQEGCLGAAFVGEHGTL